MRIFGRGRELASLRAEVAELKSIAEGYFDLKNPPASLMFSGARTQLTNEYRQLPIVFATVNAVARRAASVRPVFYRRGTDTEVDRHPVIDLLMQPRFGWSWDQWLQAWVIAKRIYGEFLAVRSREVVRSVPTSIDAVQFHNYRPRYDGGQFRGWFVNDVFYEHAEVIFDKYPNPWDDIRGLSPLASARISSETEWSARRFNKRFFDNDATPGGYFKAPNGLTETQRQRLRHELIESRKGSENSHSWLLLEGDTDIEQLGLSQRDAQFIEQFGLTLHDICAVMAVDPSVIGFEKESKYASAKEARRYLWTDSVIPELTNIENTLNRQLLDSYGLELHFDTEGIEALQENFHETIGSAEKLWLMGVPFNTINERFDMGFPPIPGGDQPRSAGAVIPQLSHRPDGRKEMVIGPPVAEGCVATEDIEKTVLHMQWKAANDEVATLVAGLTRRLRRYFFDARKKLERKIKGFQPKTKDVDYDDIAEAISLDKLMEIISEFTALSAGVGWRQVTGSYVSSAPPQEVLNVLARRISMVKEIVQNARNEVVSVIERDLNAFVARAIEEGWTEQQLADAIAGGLDHAMENLQSRARTIARTEVHSVHAEARYEAMLETEPVAKRWIAAPDARQSHQDCEGQGVLSWGETFGNGLQYPMEPGGPAEEVINCRCVLVPIYEGERAAGGRRNE